MPTHPTIESMQQHAAMQGGKCLSKEYWDDISRLMWMCAKGHVWESPWHVISRGAWCPGCAKEEAKEERKKARQEKYLEALQKYSNEKGGECLSNEFIDIFTKMQFRCSEGHLFETCFLNIKRKSWCPECYKNKIRKKQFEKIKKNAIEKEGECLSNEYKSKKTKTQFRCKEGHKWFTTPQSVINGYWCPECGKKKAIEHRKLKIDVFQKIAAERGGRLLSENYITSSLKLLWECSEGHQWCAAGNMVKFGNWCPYCAGQHKTIKDMQEIAAKHGGKCLSDEYINGITKLEWQCSEGHVWKATQVSVENNNNWCPTCGRISTSRKLFDNIETYKKIASERGGKLLSDTYNGCFEPLLWECEKGHQWYANGTLIKNHKSWCPYCRVDNAKTIKDMQELVAKRGGKCLSEKYVNNKTKLNWQCSEGHIWEATPNNIILNHWCPECRRKTIMEKQKDSIEIYRKIAIERGGKLLSDVYIRCDSPLLWECEKGHQWKAKPERVKNQQSWCPQCYNIKRKGKRSIEEKAL